jgi:hypothetical protein
MDRKAYGLQLDGGEGDRMARQRHRASMAAAAEGVGSAAVQVAVAAADTSHSRLCALACLDPLEDAAGSHVVHLRRRERNGDIVHSGRGREVVERGGDDRHAVQSNRWGWHAGTRCGGGST